MNNQKISFLVLLLLAITAASLAPVVRQQDRRADEQRNSIQRKIHAEDYPVADYQSSDSNDPMGRNKRTIKNKSHDLWTDPNAEEVRRFVLKESDPEILIPLAVSHAKTEVGIPANESQVIAIGEVNNAQAYLSGDKTNVYSEFTVTIADVFKNSTNEQINFGAQIAVERPGGRVRFPSGRILLRGAPYGRNMPLVGRRYIFFLKETSDGLGFPLITAYELRSGYVFPLDGSPQGDVKSSQFAEYESLAGVTELTFIKSVRAAVEKPTPK